jgi:serine/threonine protein kinase
MSASMSQQRCSRSLASALCATFPASAFEPHRYRYLFHDRTETKLRLFIELFHGTLRDLLNKRHATESYLSPAAICKLLCDISAGINHLHQNYVLHRGVHCSSHRMSRYNPTHSDSCWLAAADVKSDNVFISLNEHGQIQRSVIGDFDTSIRLKSLDSVAVDVIGTPSFIAPEVLNVKQIGGYGFKADGM